MRCCTGHKDISNNNERKSEGVKGLKSKWPYLCGVGIVGAIAAVTIFKIPPSSLLFYGALLACPFAHVLMMKDHDDHKGGIKNKK